MKYFMLNAAVAMEAYEPVAGVTQESHDNMTPTEWTSYPDRVRATHWYELFPEDDGRQLLTWKGRFSNVTNVVNFYSTQEEVVNNADFKTNTVFYCYPTSMNSTNIPLLVRGAHLAQGIPALTPAAGVTNLGGDLMDGRMVDMNDDSSSGVVRPNGWPSKSSYPYRWLHSDIKDVSYFFNFKFYEKVIEKGGLQ